jgi:O-antigen/teichoic acid export membrane protein
LRQADRIIFNTISNYSLTFFTMATQIVMVPIVIHRLGKSGFGLANMVLVPFGLFEVLTGSFGRALHRYIPLDLASSDELKVSRTFTTAMLGYVLMGVVGAVSVWFAFDWLLAGPDVPPELVGDGRTAMWILMIWLVVGFPLWGYRKGLEAIQRYDLLGFSHGLITLVRTVAVIIVFWMGHGSVTFFVASHLVSLIFVNLLCRYFLLRAVPSMRERPSLIDRATIVLVGTFAAATLVGMVGEICGSYGYRMFVGKELGLEKLGVLAALFTLQQTMCRLIDELTNAFSPAISSMDAAGASGAVVKLMLTGTKSSMFVAAAMTVVPIAAAAPFLHLWLGKDFLQYDALLYVLLLLTLLYCVGLTPTSVLFGLGRARTTGTVMFVRGVAGLLLSWAYVRWVSPSLLGAVACMYGVQYSGGLWMLWSACRAVGVRSRLAVWEVIVRPLSLALMGALATWGLLQLVGVDRIWKLGIAVAGGEAVLLGLILVAGLGEEERTRIMSFFGRAWIRVSGTARTVGG